MNIINFKNKVVNFSAIKESDWKDIFQMSEEFKAKGYFNGDHSKCVGAASIIYVIMSDGPISSESGHH